MKNLIRKMLLDWAPLGKLRVLEVRVCLSEGSKIFVIIINYAKNMSFVLSKATKCNTFV